MSDYYKLKTTYTYTREKYDEEAEEYITEADHVYHEDDEDFNTLPDLMEWITNQQKYGFDSGTTIIQWMYNDSINNPSEPIPSGICITNTYNHNNTIEISTVWCTIFHIHASHMIGTDIITSLSDLITNTD
jgi:hypothetical protein